MFTINKKDITGFARFEAALVGEVAAPEECDLIALEEGDEKSVAARMSFDVLGANGWKRYYAVKGTVISGPAIIGAPVENGIRDGIFEEEAVKDVASVKMFMTGFVVMSAFALAAFRFSDLGSILFMVAGLSSLFSAMTHLPFWKTELEAKLKKDHRPREEVLPDRLLETIRSRSS